MSTATPHGTTILLAVLRATLTRADHRHQNDYERMDSSANLHANLSSNHDSAIQISSNAMSTFSFHVPTKRFSDYACRIFLRNTIFLVISPFTSSLVFRSAKFHEFRILVVHSPLFHFLNMFFCSPFQDTYHL